MKILKTLFVAALGMAAFLIVPAQASTFTYNTFDPAVLSNLSYDSASGTVVEGVTGSTIDRRSPWQDTSNSGATYTAVLNQSSATYDFTSSMNSISFLWGSVDSYNTINFYSGAVLVDTLEGQEVINDNAPEGTGWINISILAASFDSMEFVSTDNAFEYSNLEVTTVPLPAALPLYGAGIAVLGFIGWRKRRQRSAAA